MSRKPFALAFAGVVILLVAASFVRIAHTPAEPDSDALSRRLTEVDDTVGVDPDWLEAEVERIEADTDTSIGIVLIDDDDAAVTAGDVTSLAAWSTIKVPVAMAATEHCDASEEVLDTLITSTIEVSDNGSADQLWMCLAAAGGAKKLVADELAKADATATLEEAWGTSEWSLNSQARYAHYLAELSDREPDNAVLDKMVHVDKSQSWGLGALGIPFKGGWSDDTDGSWQSRQLGFGQFADKRYGISMAAISEDGSFEDTTDALDELAEALASVSPASE